MFSNIPGELRALRQWVIADMSIDSETGKPRKLPLNPRTGQVASVTDRSTWGSFEEAILTGYKNIGFVLSIDDPFAIIDLDNKPENPATEEELARHYKILNAFDSYTERSTSGTGYHIIIRGSLPTGVHRDKVEAYSSGRYMICTGDVVHAKPIVNRQALLTQLYNEMAPPKVEELVDCEGTMTDSELVEMACNAANADKFNKLCNGDWKNEYPSQSEADFALMSMFAFYSRDNEQCRRLFRMTALGKRDKATKNNVYLNRALGKIRGTQGPVIDLSQLVANAEAMLKRKQNPPYDNARVDVNIVNNDIGILIPPEPPTSAEPVPAHTTLPPGIIGELATYFYKTAIRPVPEAALAAAIGIISGIVGRSYNISGTGLNQYLILLARTGSGKEGMSSGIERLISAVRPQIPMADDFIGPANFASGQSLIKVLDTRPCFVSILGEFGLTLQEISDPRSNGAQKMLKRVLLDLYTKSGWNNVLRSSVYADIEKNTKIIRSPSVTILGESTPETFYEKLDHGQIAEGLIPRFSIIEYTGLRPNLNEQAGASPSPQLLQRFSDLIAVALTTSNNNTCCPVSTDEHGLKLLDAFEKHATSTINGTKHDIEVHLWNRAHLKALKLAALIAVGINPHSPVITKECASWAIDFITCEIEGVAKRFREGDVGTGDNKQMLDMRRTIESFFKMNTSQLASYNLNKDTWTLLRKGAAVPYRFLSIRASSLTSFKNDRLGSTNAIRKTIQTMIDCGMLLEIPKVQSMQTFKFHGICYGISGNW